MLPDFSHPIYNSEAAAIAHHESIVWPDGPVCPHCNENRGRAYKLEGVRGSKSRARHALASGSARNAASSSLCV